MLILKKSKSFASPEQINKGLDEQIEIVWLLNQIILEWDDELSEWAKYDLPTESKKLERLLNMVTKH